MSKSAFDLSYEDLPETLPIFPLSNALLLPGGHLPLNIFEPRYLDMVSDALAGQRLIGMIQPRGGESLYETGCAGRIVEFSETDDGRFLIKLSGVCRFQVKEELSVATKYRQIIPAWENFRGDFDRADEVGLDRAQLKTLLMEYFKDQDMDCDWQKLEDTPEARLITCLSMICPFDAREKQALLEASCCKSRADFFMRVLEMAVRGKSVEQSVSKH